MTSEETTPLSLPVRESAPTYGEPAPFHLVRYADVTGVSGTGVVADGCVFGNGKAVLAWRPGVAAAASVAVYDSIDDVVKIHGHEGATRVEPLA